MEQFEFKNLSEVLLATVGGMISYFLRYYKEKESDVNYKFSFIFFFINMIIGGFVGYIVGDLIAGDNNLHDFIIGMSGIASYPLLLILESKFLTLIKVYLNSKIFGLQINKIFNNEDSEILKSGEKETGPGARTPIKEKQKSKIIQTENYTGPDRRKKINVDQVFD